QRVVDAAGGPIDVTIILGSGLSNALAARAVFSRIGYGELEEIPVAPLAGHAGEALIGTWNDKRILAFAGRAHLYQGFSAQEVTFNVALGAESGATTVIATNAAGALNPAFHAGDLMLISDHINLTGTNPLVGSGFHNPFVDMMNAYSPRLREIARARDCGVERPLREGVYVSVLGPSYETPAEAHYLRSIGADAVGMSTVHETILARSKGLEVLGVSLITNVVGAPETSHPEVTTVAAQSADRLADLIEGVVSNL
ncbi:MAG: purine-nucleoside phosphorylase, partial [Candidatus Eremiobacteraeota bacterium]|nr:purine-nucleoside phosphorylase [Candidatus Eremiobacteraeota bacterium]